MKDWILDLFSGLGGASEAFVNHPQWRVVRIEKNPILASVPHTRLLDILEWMDWLPALIEEMGCLPTVVWASPECKDYSNAFSSPKSRWNREHGSLDDYEPASIDQLHAVEDILEFLGDGICSPGRFKFWIVENVAGASPWFTPALGPLSQKIGGVLLWGEFPKLYMPKGWSHSKMDGDSWSDDPLRYNKRSLIPMEISEALLNAVHSQSSLADFV